MRGLDNGEPEEYDEVRVRKCDRVKPAGERDERPRKIERETYEYVWLWQTVVEKRTDKKGVVVSQRMRDE